MEKLKVGDHVRIVNIKSSDPDSWMNGLTGTLTYPHKFGYPGEQEPDFGVILDHPEIGEEFFPMGEEAPFCNVKKEEVEKISFAEWYDHLLDEELDEEEEEEEEPEEEPEAEEDFK